MCVARQRPLSVPTASIARSSDASSAVSRPAHICANLHWIRSATPPVLIFVFITLTFSQFLCGQGSPAKTLSKSSWSSFRHDLSQTGVATTTLPEKLEKLWEVELGEQILATAAIAGDFVYVPCLSGELVCLEKATGNKVWAYKSVEVVPANSFAPGFKSSPTITEDSIYLGDEEGVFHGIDRATGKGRWKFATGGEIYSSAAVTDGRILFGSYDNNLYCLNLDGTEAWRFVTQGYVHCAPAVSEGTTFIAGCDEHLRMIDVSTGKEVGELKLESYLIASPTVIGDILYVGTYRSEVVAVDWKAKKLIWQYQGGNGEYRSSTAVTNDLVVVGGRDKMVHAMDRKTGKKAWTFQTRNKVDSSPVVVGNRVFVGSNDHYLYELDLKTGKELWKFDAGKPISASPAVGEGVLVIGSESRDGKVYCFGKK